MCWIHGSAQLSGRFRRWVGRTRKTTPALAHWNPSSTLCTAREIITLWVSRMVMFNLYLRGCLPFQDVFIHAMIQDGEGRKMSKSLGNGVDPLDIIHSHGADALRFTLAQMTTQTQDVRMPVVKDPATGRNTSPKFDLGRNFSNKIWNATRFAMSVLEQSSQQTTAGADPQSPGMAMPGSSSTNHGLVNEWILSRLAQLVSDSQSALAQFEFSRYAQGLYDFFWRDLCDWYIEAIKPRWDRTSPSVRCCWRVWIPV
ncbi:MAG: class I tRNA ligase family protein [Phycisphaerales bacterium]|nr:class I tRNA ligase family protein [Phycisphaerales bacterium]